MPNVSYTLKEAVVCCVEHYLELLKNLKLEKDDFIPRKHVKEFFERKFGNEIESIIFEFELINSKRSNICFLDFWKLFEQIMIRKQLIKISCEDFEESILYGMIYLRDQIIKQSSNILDDSSSLINNSSDISCQTEKISVITIDQIHSIMLEIISNNICNESSSFYWQDVLKQIPQELNQEISLDLIDVSTAILKWLKEYLIFKQKQENAPVSTTSAIITQLVTVKDEIVQKTGDPEEINILGKSELKSVSHIEDNFDYISKISKEKLFKQDTVHFEEISNEHFEILPWKDQTMFSNFRELQISLQNVLEKITFLSERNEQFSKKDEFSVRKISHMMTELEDYLYQKFDVHQKEKVKFDSIDMENKNLKKQLRMAVKELKDQQVELQDSVSQKNKFEKEIKHLISERSRLSLDIVGINQEKKFLERKYDNILCEFNSLKEKHEILIEEHQQLLIENERLKSKISEIKLTRDEICIKSPIHEMENNERNNSCLQNLESKYIDKNKEFINKYDNKSLCSKNLSEKSTLKKNNSIQEDEVKELPAVITSIPDFLESKIGSITSQIHKKKNSHFPDKKLLEKSRIVKVVPPINKETI